MAETEPWVRALHAREALCHRAPSAHNTQPWTLRYEPDAVTVGWDPGRELPTGDPTRRDLYLSLGAFIETALIVAADAGLAVRAEIAVDTARHTVARLHPADRPYATGFTAATVTARTCARGPHHPGRLPAAELAAARGVLDRTRLVEIPARTLVDPCVRADRWLFGNAPVVAELRDWLRLHRRHPRYAADGLTYEALAMSRTEAAALRAALAPRPYGLLRRLGLARALAAAQRSLLAYDGSVLALVGRADDPVSTVAAGGELVRVWYALSERGVLVHPLSQLIDCPTTNEALSQRLAPPPDRLLAVFRAGRPRTTPPPHSARRVQETPPSRPTIPPTDGRPETLV